MEQKEPLDQDQDEYDGRKTKELKKGPFLRNIDLSVAQGEFVAVVGEVGSGKTALAYALLRELRQPTGKMAFASDAPIAFMSQEHWILGATVRDNILFGSLLDEKRYQEVLRISQLEEDLDSFEKGDLTKVGERGTRLSGGQKARVALARACYAVNSCDVFVFDDPLKDLDAKVSNRVFRECFLKWLFGKTRIMFTHNVQVLPHVDRVLVLDEGRIVRQGSYSELQQAARGLSSRELVGSPLTPFMREPENAPKKSERSREFLPKDDGDNERRLADLGKDFKFGIIWRYFGTRYRVLLAAFLATVMIKCIGDYSREIILGKWSNDPDFSDHSLAYYVSMYLGIGFGVTISCGIGQFFWTIKALSTANEYHAEMLRSILRAPARFFDLATSGNILSRFSEDLFKLDDSVRWKSREMMINLIYVVFTYGLVSYYVPWFLALLLPVLGVFAFFGRTFVKALLALSRFQAGMHSPIVTHFNETIKGLTTLRAFKKERVFCKKLEDAVDLTNRIDTISSSISRWVWMRGRLVAGTIVLFFMILGIFTGLQGVIAALVLTRLSNMEYDMSWVLMLLPSIQKDFVSVERVEEYVNSKTEVFEGTRPSDFPTSGAVEFRNVVFRYDVEKQHDILKNVSLRIPGGKKVGICGRTGSGKSTLVKLLFRLYSTVSGDVLIDGHSVTDIALPCLRTSLSYIAQNPTLLNGTLRENMDQGGDFPDGAIWDALDQVGLGEKARKCAKKTLYAKVGEEINFSAGEKQLLCFGRALLHKKKVVVMDEATSSCDLETDRKIQDVVNRCFGGCTIIAIAHRLETICDFDLIAVMKDGEVVEYASPKDLVSDRHSEFYSLVQETGKRRSKRLLAMAKRSPRGVPQVPQEHGGVDLVGDVGTDHLLAEAAEDADVVTVVAGE